MVNLFETEEKKTDPYEKFNTSKKCLHRKKIINRKKSLNNILNSLYHCFSESRIFEKWVKLLFEFLRKYSNHSEMQSLHSEAC